MKKSLKVVLAAMSLSPLFFGSNNVQAQSAANQEISFLGNWKRRPIEDIMTSIQLSVESGSKTYIVQWGDTLNSIALATGIHVKDLVQINSIANPDLILAGATITFNPQTQTIVYDDLVSEETEVPAPNTDDENVEGILEETHVEEITSEEEYLVVDTEEVEAADVPTAILELETEETSFNHSEAQNLSVEILEELITEEPIIEEPIIEEPIVEEPIVEEPIVEEPIVEEPIVEEPIVEEPIVEEPIVEAPTNVSSDPSAAFSQIVADKGVSASEADMWSFIINRESSWNPTISNPSSGAYGLPQALPGSKMASHGADWQTNPYTQLSWMYDYMVGRYGSIAGAYEFWQNNHWY